MFAFKTQHCFNYNKKQFMIGLFLKKSKNTLLVYFPFIIANCLFCFIMMEYYLNFLFLFSSNQIAKLFSFYRLQDFQLDVKVFFLLRFEFLLKGLQILFSFSEFMLFLSLFRVFTSNPGYLPSPIELEWKILQTKKQVTLGPNSLKKDIYSQQIHEKKSDNENHFKLNVYQNIENLSQCGPLTFTEYEMIMKEFNCFLNEDKNLNNNKSQTYDHQSSNTQLFKPSISQMYSEISRLSLCHKCIRFKPERTHHCSQCNKCVLKMDHHCPWIANCIGLFNYKYFLLTLIYTLISSSIVLLTLWDSIIAMLFSSKVSVNQCIWCIFAYICNALIWLFSGYLTILNIKLVCINKTTIELADETRFNNSNEISKIIVQEDDVAIKEYSKYNKGILTNLKEVLGNCIIVWGIPFFSPKVPDNYYINNNK